MTPAEANPTGVGANRRLLDGFLRALDVPPAVLVGNSMGGMISLIQAAHAPATVRALVLADAAFPRGRSVSSQPTPWIAAAFAIYSTSRLGERVLSVRARRLGAEGLVRETFRLCAADPDSIDPALVAAHVEMVRTREGFEYARQAFLDAARSIFRSQARPGKYRALVRAVRTPALVLHGARDRLIPVAAARESSALHDNWDLVVFDHLGHLPMMEDPDRFLRTVEEWLDRKSTDLLPGGLQQVEQRIVDPSSQNLDVGQRVPVGGEAERHRAGQARHRDR